ncbi:MAG: 16S rRNA (guanine(527)-N(7))-methyltransferase RsmG [Clostridia bacterium]|nr:16S rRNA (guanine(527)-N(7))-methyltransferase RsmG [Clostridia bacterium]
MEKVFNVNNLKIEKNAVETLQLFCDFLLEKNKQFNITAIRDKEGVFEKHFADSLMGKDYFFKNAKILEVGSGGGFPSIPLKANEQSLNFTLLEATGKKCEFLKQAKDLLGFENFTVINGRAEELARNKDYREHFDIVTARAVAELNVLAELCLPFLKVGGIAVFYKLKSEEELTRGKNSVKILGGEICEIKNYTLQGVEGERNIIIIKKVAPTAEKYPREYKKIIKSPLI